MKRTCAAMAVWQESPETPKPDVSFIPPLERRRLTGVERAALAVAWQVRTDAPLPVVFASRWGEIGVTVKLMQQFHADGEMSPAGFSASVHNAAPGAFSLLTRDKAPYTAIAAGERSLESGLLEALAWQQNVLFVYAEEATPAFYRPAFDQPQRACAVAVRFTRTPAEADHAARMPVDADRPLVATEPQNVRTFTAAFENLDVPPATFEEFTAFLLVGRAPDFITAHLQLT